MISLCVVIDFRIKMFVLDTKKTEDRNLLFIYTCCGFISSIYAI